LQHATGGNKSVVTACIHAPTLYLRDANGLIGKYKDLSGENI